MSSVSPIRLSALPELERTTRAVREITGADRSPCDSMVCSRPRRTSIHVPEQDPSRAERAGDQTGEPSPEVARAFATLMELAAALDRLDLEGVEPVFIPREM